MFNPIGTDPGPHLSIVTSFRIGGESDPEFLLSEDPTHPPRNQQFGY